MIWLIIFSLNSWNCLREILKEILWLLWLWVYNKFMSRCLQTKNRFTSWRGLIKCPVARYQWAPRQFPWSTYMFCLHPWLPSQTAVLMCWGETFGSVTLNPNPGKSLESNLLLAGKPRPHHRACRCWIKRFTHRWSSSVGFSNGRIIIINLVGPSNQAEESETRQTRMTSSPKTRVTSNNGCVGVETRFFYPLATWRLVSGQWRRGLIYTSTLINLS